MNGLVTLFALMVVGGFGVAVAHVFDRWVQRRRDVHTARTRPVPTRALDDLIERGGAQ